MEHIARKHFSISSKMPGDAPRVIRFIGSDESIDRDGDIIAVSGWDIAKYMKNPVVLFGHDSYALPIAKTVAINTDSYAKALLFDIYFPTVEELATDPAMPSEHALRVDAIYNMAKAGLLNAVSVGFRGIEWEQTKTGRMYTKQELMEISIVPVPANPNAIAIMRSAGVDDAVLKGVFMETTEKSGRVLSSKNKETLAKIRDTLEACRDELRKFLDETAPDEVEPEPEPEPEPEAMEPKKKEDKSADEAVIYFELIEKDSTGSTKGETL